MRKEEWLKTISSEDPVKVKVVPVGFHGCCYMNCVAIYCGPGEEKFEIILGWAIWEHRGIIELEHHCVLRLPDGTLEDPTPTQDGEKEILFLPDPRPVGMRGRKFQGYFNVRYPNTEVHRRDIKCFTNNLFGVFKKNGFETDHKGTEFEIERFQGELLNLGLYKKGEQNV